MAESSAPDLSYIEIANAVLNDKKMSNYLFDVRNQTLCSYYNKPYNAGSFLRLLAHYVPQIDCLFWGNDGINQYVIDHHYVLECILKLKPSVFVFPILTGYAEPRINGPLTFDPKFITATEKVSFSFLWSDLPPYYSISVYESNPQQYMQAISYFKQSSLVHEYFTSKVYFPKLKGRVMPISSRDIAPYHEREDVRAFAVRTINHMVCSRGIVKADDLICLMEEAYKFSGGTTSLTHTVALWIAQDIVTVRKVANALKKILRCSVLRWAKPLSTYWAEAFSKLPIFNQNKSFMQVVCKILTSCLESKLSE